MTEDNFRKDIKEGLSKNSKSIPSKYFYNKEGDRLFQKIMTLPQYYLTKAEDEIFSNQSKQIIQAFQFDPTKHFEVIDLGAGDGTKTIKLLQKFLSLKYDFTYIPVDISVNTLNHVKEKLKRELPLLKVRTTQGNYVEVVESLNKSNNPKIVLFLGSNIGNMDDNQAKKFISAMSFALSKKDVLLLGVDLIKDKKIIMPAYDDEQGVTKAFNLNVLQRINDELDANFNLQAFDHAPHYDPKTGVAKSYIKSLKKQEVDIKELHLTIKVSKGELIHTEISRKYNRSILNDLIQNTNFIIEKEFKDNKGYFCDYLLRLC